MTDYYLLNPYIITLMLLISLLFLATFLHAAMVCKEMGHRSCARNYTRQKSVLAATPVGSTNTFRRRAQFQRKRKKDDDNSAQFQQRSRVVEFPCQG